MQFQPKESSSRFMFIIEAFTKLFVSKVEIIGKERLEQLSPQARPILAITHISELDSPLAVAALGHNIPLMMTDMSIHRNFWDSLRSADPTIGVILLAGKKNFLPITYTQKKGARQGRINPADISRIEGVLKGGKAVVIAAHNPAEGRLSDKPGAMAVMVALSVEDSVVIPVAVQIGEGAEQFGLTGKMLKTFFKRPKVKVTLGEPIIFNDPDAKQAVATIKEVTGRGLRELGDQERFKEARWVVNGEGARLMRALAAMLPPEKRGIWNVDAQTPNVSS
ncbi:MAG: hypothetical protein Q7R82_00455 [Candidatus Daviesbacteria bacterium]|nr:hypothetical protein [Candidatus Daviesbacteria bacterium]